MGEPKAYSRRELWIGPRFEDCGECGRLTAYHGRHKKTVRERLGLCPDCCRERFKDHQGAADPLMFLRGVYRGMKRCPWSGKLQRIKGTR